MALDNIDFEMQGWIKYVVKDSTTHDTLDSHEQHNMIVRGIRPVIVQLLAQSGYSTPLPKIDTIRFGDSSSPSTVNDTTLKGNLIVSKPILSSAALSDSNRKATFSVLLGDNEANDTNIREAGLYSGDILVARTTFGTYTKAAGTYFEFYWTIGYDA